MTLSFLLDIFIIWFNLGVIALFLIQFRQDKDLIERDFMRMYDNGFRKFLSALLITIIFLPITIPYSIKNIKWK